MAYFECKKCNFTCLKKSDYLRHEKTKKHLLMTTVSTYTCDVCGKEYKFSSGLSRHKSKCFKSPITPNSTNTTTPTIIYRHNDDNATTGKVLSTLENTINTLVRENAEFRSIISQLVERGTSSTTTINNISNRTFNLQLFLNETCKDAMNMSEFINSIHLQLDDFLDVGKNGFIEGISNIIINRLSELDITRRPIHCTDKKREVLYIKDDNKWEKEEGPFPKLRDSIRKVCDKNSRLLISFKDKYPDYKQYNSQTSEVYTRTVIEALGGHGENREEKENKIISNISKHITIEK